MLIFIFVKALIVQLIDSKNCKSGKGDNINLFSCIGCTVNIDCALNKTIIDPLWSRNRKPIPTNSKRLKTTEENKFSLQISDLVKSDNAKYCCFAISRKVFEQYCASLEIIELLVLPNDTIAGTNGSSVVVTCAIKNDIPGVKTISLIKNGIIVRSNNSNILTAPVQLTTDVYNQNLRCKADLDCLDVPLEQDVKFSVTYPPLVKVAALPSKELHEKDNMSLTCTHESYPYANFITWTKNGNAISHETEYQKFNISREDNGLYVCNVSNTIGYGIDKVQISVYFAPEVTVEQLKNGSLFCNATGIPNSYTFSKWEHHSIDGYYLRTLESIIPTLLTIDNKHDKPTYTIDGRYQCNVSNGVTDEKNLTFQNGYKDVYFPGKPHCFPKNNEEIIRNINDSVIITFDVYSSTITHYEWWHGNCSLNQTFEYELTTNQSTTSVTVYGISISLNTTTFALKISNLAETHFETQYTLFVYNEQGNSTCSTTLLEGRVPQKPTEFGVKAYKNGILANWISGFDGGYPQEFVIKYRFVLDDTWSVHRVKPTKCTSERICTVLIEGIFKDVHYFVYMYAENELGKSSKTNLATIEIKTITHGSQQEGNNLFSKITEKLLISLISTLFVIVTFILCCLRGQQYRRNRINAPSTRNQSYTVNRNGHYEEIDTALEINVNNTLSPANDRIDIHEMHNAEQMPMPNSILTIREIVEETMRDISMRVFTETTATVVRENQLKLIKETVRQVLRENYDLQQSNTHSTSSIESEHDTNDENGYLNPYQPLNINVDSCEHPYTDTTLKDNTPNKREIKNYSIDTLSFHSENATSEL